MKAYKTEWDALTSTVLVELDPSHPEYETAVRKATGGRLLLEFKRTGVWKARAVVQGFKENKLELDGPDFDYAANVCEFTAVRNLLFAPRASPYGNGAAADPEVIVQVNIAIARPPTLKRTSSAPTSPSATSR